MYKTYVYIKFQLDSPLAISSGKSNVTDKDVLRNSKGEPYIPASSLAGVYSTFFEEADIKKYFGYVDDKKAKESSVIVYDAKLCGKSTVGIRNGVGLDKYRTAKDGAKFDFETIEPGSLFETALEYSSEEDNGITVLKTIVSAWKDKKITLGSKTMRGLGQVSVVDTVKYQMFNLPSDRKKWLEFDIFEKKSVLSMEDWKEEYYVSTNKDQISIELTLKQEGPLSVRVYSTDVSKKDETAPDNCQLSFNKEGKEIAVVPGTSWAGTFRHHMEDLGVDEAQLNNLFGIVKEKDKIATKSKIRFSETYFENGEYKIVSRNAINRFSGGAADTALFTEKMYIGGSDGELKITFPQDIDSNVLNSLAICIADLNEGFLVVGGESSIGHGLFTISKVKINNAQETVINTSEEVYSLVKSCKGGE